MAVETTELEKFREETIGTITEHFMAGGFRDSESLSKTKRALSKMIEDSMIDPQFAQDLYSAAVMQNVFSGRKPEAEEVNASPAT